MICRAHTRCPSRHFTIDPLRPHFTLERGHKSKDNLLPFPSPWSRSKFPCPQYRFCVYL